MYTYAWYHWIAFFYFYCFFGWVFESAYVSMRKKRFVNRGFLRLPMLPLYGTGAVMMLWVSLPVKDNLFLVYLSGVIAATLLEYVTGYAMELLFKVKYWDYSDQRFNLNGYICLSSSIAWGFLTILMTEIIHRPVEQFILQLNPILEWVLLTLITIPFLTDIVQSTKDALDLARALEAVTRLRGELDELQVQIALLKAELSQDIQERLEEHEDKLQSFKLEQELKLLSFKDARESRIQAIRETQENRLQAIRETQENRIQAIRETQEARLRALNAALSEKTSVLRQQLAPRRRNILHRNPSASSRQFAAALKELKESFEDRTSRKQP